MQFNGHGEVERGTSSSIEMRDTETSATSDMLMDVSFLHSDVPSAQRSRRAMSTESTFQEQTLSNYLINNKQYTRLLSLCGGLHIPMRLNYNDFCMNSLNLWRVLLILATTVQIAASIFDTTRELRFTRVTASLLFLWPLVSAL